MSKLSIRSALALLLGIAMLAAVAQAGTVSLAIDPRSTYLLTNQDPFAQSAIVDLSSLGIHPGDTITLNNVGDIAFCDTCGEVRPGVVAVFSSNSTLLDPSQLHRVPGAIAAGNPWVTPNTLFGDLSTDIPEDFLVWDPTQVVVPTGAQFLFLSINDSYFGDNTDPNGDFRVTIETAATPEPASLILLGSGIGFLPLLRRNRR